MSSSDALVPGSPSDCRPDPAKIVVPREHGQILVEPSMARLRAAAGASSPLPGGAILGIPLSALRARAREDLVSAMQSHAATINAPAPGSSIVDRPWIVTGHQVEFYHPGVWAKVVAADALARRANSVAIDLLVDHDVADHIGFDVPAQDSAGRWNRQHVSWRRDGVRHAQHVALDGIALPTPAEFGAWDAALAGFPAAHADTLAFVLSSLGVEPWRAAGIDEPGSYTPWMSRARNMLELALGLDVHHVPTSGLCDSFAWSAFVLAWIANADSWTLCYNRHLAAYRKAQGIHNDHHPMPDLQRGAAWELPFWIYRVGAARERLFVRANSTGMEILHGPEVIVLPVIQARSEADGWALARQFAEVLASRRLVVRPRALTLTMFTRLFVSDLFIHGIGGALYDQITNGIVEELFGWVPAYACVSATWLLPLGSADGSASPAEVSRLRHLRHHVRHNPQLAIDPFTLQKAEMADLAGRRQELVRAIAASLAKDRKTGREQRLTLYRELHQVIEQLHARAPQVLGTLDAQVSAAAVAAEQNQVLHWREYYFGLHSMDSLRRFIDRIRAL